MCKTKLILIKIRNTKEDFKMYEVNIKKLKKAFLDIKNKYPEGINLEKINAKIKKIDSIATNTILIENLEEILWII